MSSIGYPDFMYTAEHYDFSQFEKGKLIRNVYFWTTANTNEAIEHYLKLISDKFLPSDGQTLVSRTWGRSKANAKRIVVRCVYEVNG